MAPEETEKTSTCSKAPQTGEERPSTCPCMKSCSCADKAPVVGLAILIAGLGALALRTARKRSRSGHR